MPSILNDQNIMNEMAQVHSNAPVILQKWAPELGAINEAFEGKLDYMRQVSTAILLESTANHLDRLAALSAQNPMGAMNEATQPSDVGYFKKYAINLLSAAVPNLIAPEIVSMQPMLSRVGEMRFLKILYGSNKGSVKAGDTMFSMFQGGNGETAYSSDEVDSEYVTASGTSISGNLAWLPVVPGSVKLTVGLNEATDDGKGNLVGTSISAGTIDYSTGAYSVTLKAAPDASDEVYFNYRYNNMDVPVQAPEVNLKIEVAPIIAKSRKLKTLYSFDAAFDMTKDYGMQINNELVAYTATNIKHEIDGEIMGDLLRIASAKAVQWDATPRDGISLRDHNESFYNKVVEAGNNIFDATKLANGSWIITGMDGANIIETLPRFRPSGVVNPVGPHLVGYLGNMPVYKDPFYPTDAFLVGWRGTGLFDAGYLYCPYMPIMTTQLIMDANFEGQRGFATSYGKKPVNSKMYSRGTITRS